MKICSGELGPEDCFLMLEIFRDRGRTGAEQDMTQVNLLDARCASAARRSQAEKLPTALSTGPSSSESESAEGPQKGPPYKDQQRA